MGESEDEIVRRLQAKSDQDRSEPIEVEWPDPGPYRIPACTGQQGLVDLNNDRWVELLLETDTSQIVRVPMTRELAYEIYQALAAYGPDRLLKPSSDE